MGLRSLRGGGGRLARSTTATLVVSSLEDVGERLIRDKAESVSRRAALVCDCVISVVGLLGRVGSVFDCGVRPRPYFVSVGHLRRGVWMEHIAARDGGQIVRMLPL